MTNNYILAISGNDIFSGGGLHADLTTYAINKLHGFVAVTCLTAMTDKGFEVFPINPAIFSEQLNSLADIPFSAIKIGLLPDVATADLTLNFIKEHTDIPIILDPVLVCKESHDVEVSALREELLKFFSYATVITPNLVEAELLAQTSIKNLDDMKKAAKKLYDLGAKNVVIKGGSRLDPQKATDLFFDGERAEILEYPVLKNNNIGAGCTFASSIASQIALGESVLEAVKISKDFVYQAIEHSDQYGVSQHYEEN